MRERSQSSQREKALSRASQDEIDLVEIWDFLVKGKWIVIGLTLIFSTISVFYALSLPNMYKSTAVLAPAESKTSGLAALANQFGGLASIAGIDLGGGSSDKTAEALEVIRSWSFIEEFIEEQDIAPEVFAAKGWDLATRELIFDTSIYDPVGKKWVREPPKNKKSKPSSWELYERFQDFIVVEKSIENGFVTLDIEYFSPELAKEWAEALVVKINGLFKSREEFETSQNISFLKAQIEGTSVSSMQVVFFNLIEEQTKSLMLAKNTEDFVFSMVSKPRVPEERSSPKRALICIFGAMLGGFLGCIIAQVRGFNSNNG